MVRYRGSSIPYPKLMYLCTISCYPVLSRYKTYEYLIFPVMCFASNALSWKFIPTTLWNQHFLKAQKEGSDVINGVFWLKERYMASVSAVELS